MKTAVRQVLFDFDQVLAPYRHETRIAHLATFAGCAHERVREVLFASGLETRYASGAIGTVDYLRCIGEGLGRSVDAEAWIASRMAGSVAELPMLDCVAALDASLPLGVLSNNGVLMAEAIPRIIAPVRQRFEGRVLCSGSLQLRKPDPACFRLALEWLGWDAASTLFVDDGFANVQAARALGLQADTVDDARSLRRVLKRHGVT